MLHVLNASFLGKSGPPVQTFSGTSLAQQRFSVAAKRCTLWLTGKVPELLSFTLGAPAMFCALSRISSTDISTRRPVHKAANTLIIHAAYSRFPPSITKREPMCSGHLLRATARV